jgi:hypothetical protein
VVVASLIAVVTSGCAVTVQGPSGQNGQFQRTGPTDAQRSDCARNGGVWNTAAAYCRIGA